MVYWEIHERWMTGLVTEKCADHDAQKNTLKESKN